jgi:hypothetical protein
VGTGSAIYRYLSSGRLDCFTEDRRYLSVRRTMTRGSFSHGPGHMGERNGWTEENLVIAMGEGEDGEMEIGEEEVVVAGGRYLVNHGMQLVSSHVSAVGCEPEFTTLHDQAQVTVDYIWITPRSQLCPDLREGVDVPRSGGSCVATARVCATLLPPPAGLVRYGCPSPSLTQSHTHTRTCMHA